MPFTKFASSDLYLLYLKWNVVTILLVLAVSLISGGQNETGSCYWMDYIMLQSWIKGHV